MKVAEFTAGIKKMIDRFEEESKTWPDCPQLDLPANDWYEQLDMWMQGQDFGEFK